MSAFNEYVDEVRMKRLHAILLLLRIAACIAVMIGKEVWMAARREWKNGRKAA